MCRYLTFLALVALAGCAGASGLRVSSGERYQLAADVNETYLLGAGDKVRVTVFNEPNLSGEFAVGSDGTISLPLVGDLVAQGKTTKLVADEFAAKLADGYLLKPSVAMEVSVYRPFFILGEVEKPGQYPYANGMTALNAIATAGGYTPRAKRTVVFIRKFGEAAETEYDLTSSLRILPGDTIRLGERYF
nr:MULTISPECIES: polysaccharide biosynthesis/export family protein [unclassified Novosphingobium]